MSDPKSTTDKPCLKILGQEFYYPSDWLGTAAVTITAFVVGVTVCVALAIPYRLSTEAGRAHVERMIRQASISASGQISATKSHGRMGFWAPSESTYRDIEPPAPYAWRKGRTKDEIKRFEDGLVQFGSGWRRYSVVGSGSGDATEGYWYEFTTKPAFDEALFFEFYRKHWKSETDIYFEYFVHDGGYQK
jgi:hypothetical protein